MTVKKNIDIVNSLREVSSQEFQERIPEATQENISNIFEIISEYPTLKNEFIDKLTNKVVKTVFFSKVFENNLKLFHKGTLAHGDSIESIFVDLVKAKQFSENFGGENSDVGSLVSREKASNVKVEYYSKDFAHKYKISISDERLRTAFTSQDGLQRLINQQIQAQLNSAEYDEYLLMKGLLDGAKYKKVKTVKPIDAVSTKAFTKSLKTLIGKMRFIRTDFNNQGVHTFSKPEELVVITTPDYQSELDVELLSTAFNIDKAEVQSRIILVDEFNDPNRVALIVDKEFIQFYEKLNASESFRNPDGLFTNMFLHKKGLIAQCNFVNAVELTTVIE